MLRDKTYFNKLLNDLNIKMYKGEQNMPTITDWLMVIITFVYVVATILVCIANIKSARAAKEQTEEMKKQFLAINRPIIAAEIVYLKRTFWILRFVNNGSKVSYNT